MNQEASDNNDYSSHAWALPVCQPPGRLRRSLCTQMGKWECRRDSHVRECGSLDWEGGKAGRPRGLPLMPTGSSGAGAGGPFRVVPKRGRGLGFGIQVADQGLVPE